ncbi:hypothetical protein BH23BAC4_BH23BAC4_12750 [soil metagenome]
MTFHYDQELDQLAVRLSKEPSTESQEIAPGFVVDYDSEGRVVGFEMEYASRHVELDRLTIGALPMSEFILQRSAS